ncbi:MAG: M23 family metallopeptidase [Bacteriovoracales bacterium]|nr:M23 family metallopeptidase [Bacteriovoracales bacterium]
MKTALSFFLTISLGATLFTFTGCARMQSGHYVQMRRGESLKDLSKDVGIGADKIKDYNPYAQFSPGEWVFIPLKRGLLSKDSKGDWLSSRYSSGFDLFWPVPSSKNVSSSFGHRWGRKHRGIDIVAKGGSPIVAAEGGKVIYSGNKLKSFGNMIVIRHAHGLYTLYAHNRRNHVGPGQYVAKGQLIAQVGSTGRSTGNHLHFEVRLKDEALNPLAFYRKSKRNIASRSN